MYMALGLGQTEGRRGREKESRRLEERQKGERKGEQAPTRAPQRGRHLIRRFSIGRKSRWGSLGGRHAEPQDFARSGQYSLVKDVEKKMELEGSQESTPQKRRKTKEDRR